MAMPKFDAVCMTIYIYIYLRFNLPNVSENNSNRKPLSKCIHPFANSLNIYIYTILHNILEYNVGI